MIRLPSVSFQLIEAEREHLRLWLAELLLGGTPPPYSLPVEVELPHPTPVQRAVEFGH